MKSTIILFCIALALSSCEPIPTTTANNAIYETGAWEFDTIVRENKSVFNSHYQLGFKLYPNGICDFKNGFYRYSPITDDGNDSEKFLGTKTRYSKNDDSLKIYDRTFFNGKELGWIKFGILKETPTMLYLTDEHQNVFRFKKPLHTEPAGQHYDAIIVSRGPCYGTCPINATMITSSGKMYFNGEHYNTLSGFNVGEIGVGHFKAIEDQFRKLNVRRLKDSYFDYGATCGETNYVTFIKNRKIVKTICAYTRYSGPIDLFAAYNSLSFLYQQFPMRPQTFDQRTLFWGFTPLGTNHFTYLPPSESLYLAVQLRNGNVVDDKFNAMYAFKYYDDKTGQEKQILSDGRFFELSVDGKTQTRDLGYNFVAYNTSAFRKAY